MGRGLGIGNIPPLPLVRFDCPLMALLARPRNKQTVLRYLRAYLHEVSAAGAGTTGLT